LDEVTRALHASVAEFRTLTAEMLTEADDLGSTGEGCTPAVMRGVRESLEYLVDCGCPESLESDLATHRRDVAELADLTALAAKHVRDLNLEERSA
jgi:hypothetical protein